MVGFGAYVGNPGGHISKHFLVVANNSAPVGLLLNQTGARQQWLQVRLRGAGENSHGTGAHVGLVRPGQPPLWRRAGTDGSYLSARDGRLHFGLGRESRIESVVVEWPFGKTEIWSPVEADHIILLQEGSGKPWSRQEKTSGVR